MPQNPVPAPMQDKDRLEDALNTQKYMTVTYNALANECASSGLRDELLNLLQEEHNIQADLFQEMQKRGWYPTAPASQPQIEAVKQQFSPSAPSSS
ncbi:MAG TPA: spore coat protein [Firmicutes bacterium]|nr:spore coat protein [Bacillota bacterium]